MCSDGPKIVRFTTVSGSRFLLYLAEEADTKMLESLEPIKGNAQAYYLVLLADYMACGAGFDRDGRA